VHREDQERPAFREKVLALKDVSARLQLITAEGFDCSVKELEAALEQDDATLESVAGGGLGCPYLDSPLGPAGYIV